MSVEVVLAIAGVTGTLGAALLTQVLATRAETQRCVVEDKTRWLSDRRRVSAELIAGALKLERELFSACAQLDREERAERLPGYTSVLLTSTAGLPPILDDVTRAILVEAAEDALKALDSLEVTAAEVELTGTPDEGARAQELIDSLLDALGLVESFAMADVAYDAVMRSRSAREAYLEVARAALRVDGAAAPPDSRLRQ